MMFYIDESRLWTFTCIIAATIAVAGCSNQPAAELPDEIAALEQVTVFSADSDPVYEISLNHRVIFTDVDDILLGNWFGAEVDDQDRVYIADHQNTTLHFYNQDGSYNRQIGREGEGPGEYRRISAMRTDNRYLHLMDSNLQRITIFDIETFNLIGDVSINLDAGQNNGPRPYPASFSVMDDEHYLVHFGTGYYAGSPEEEDESRRIEGRMLNRHTGTYGADVIYSFKESEALVHREGGSMMVMGVPYKHTSVVQYHNGGIIHGYSDHILLKFFDHEGQYKRAVYYPHPEVSLKRNEILEIYANHAEETRNMVRRDNMPDVWPAFDFFWVDDTGRIWVKTFTEDLDQSEYLVLDNSGELLARFNWPRNSFVQKIKNGHLYALEEDEDGMRRIVKYEIDLI